MKVGIDLWFCTDLNGNWVTVMSGIPCVPRCFFMPLIVADCTHGYPIKFTI
jgi:hypothetical protein